MHERNEKRRKELTIQALYTGVHTSKRLPLNNFVRITHTTTNRFMENFSGAVSPSVSRSNAYFDKLIAQNYQTQDNKL